MNVIPPVPTPVVFNSGTVNTESVKRDNTQRETIPALAGNESSSAEKGVGSESDRVKTPGQNPQPVTYEKPNAQNNQSVDSQSTPEKDNANDESAGKEEAEERQKEQQAQQQEQAEKQEITALKQRDLEVRAHEQAHAAAGGSYASSPQYEYEKGPDGRRYAVGGEVAIDISKEATPEETIRKAQQVKAAALAPAEPSPQDLRVANEAMQLAAEARREISAEQAEKAREAFRKAVGKEESKPNQLALDLDDFITGANIDSVPRRLKNSEDASTVESAAVSQAAQTRDLEISNRVAVIENFYQKVGNPEEGRLDLTA
ncbi:putative metalloprotease CJM1_0395 family protein [Paraglaciecola sp.]|uniref:putative metalloprotease CJM1_0395 family protein n=1 Tax=Paraglaciecola sp. TaxID=1920173 RepID=UPI003EFAED53